MLDKKAVLTKENIYSFYIYISNIYRFENKNHNHQVGIFVYTWDLNQQEPVQRGYQNQQNYMPISEKIDLNQVIVD